MQVSDVEFIILGSGTSAGVPVIGCDCAVCTSTDSRNRRTRPAACVQYRDSGGLNIEFEDEDPAVLKMFNEGLAERGVEPFVPTESAARD